MTARLPWMKLKPADALKEPTLKRCSRAARSLAWDMMWLMHTEGEPYGHLRIKGTPCDAADLAAILGDKEEDVAGWLREIVDAKVFDRDADGAFVSRRMIRDHKHHEAAKANGRLGGNPVLLPNLDAGAAALRKTVQREKAAERQRRRRTKKASGNAVEKSHAVTPPVTRDVTPCHAVSRSRHASGERDSEVKTSTPPTPSASVTGDKAEVKVRERLRERDSSLILQDVERAPPAPTEQARPPSPSIGGGRATGGGATPKASDPIKTAKAEARRKAEAAAAEFRAEREARAAS